VAMRQSRTAADAGWRRTMTVHLMTKNFDDSCREVREPLVSVIIHNIKLFYYQQFIHFKKFHPNQKSGQILVGYGKKPDCSQNDLEQNLVK